MIFYFLINLLDEMEFTVCFRKAKEKFRGNESSLRRVTVFPFYLCDCSAQFRVLKQTSRRVLNCFKRHKRVVCARKTFR